MPVRAVVADRSHSNNYDSETILCNEISTPGLVHVTHSHRLRTGIWFSCSVPGRRTCSVREAFSPIPSVCHKQDLDERTPPNTFGEVGMKRNAGQCAALGLNLALGAFSCALAQFSGSISGTVTDPAGAVIPGATVTLTNTGTGVGKHGDHRLVRLLSIRQRGPRQLRREDVCKGFRRHSAKPHPRDQPDPQSSRCRVRAVRFLPVKPCRLRHKRLYSTPVTLACREKARALHPRRSHPSPLPAAT